MNAPNRLTLKELWNELLLFFNFEKGIPFTFISVIKKPHDTITTYLTVSRRKFFNPLSYLLIAVGISTLIVTSHPGFTTYMGEIQAKNVENYKPIEKKLNLEIMKPFEKSQQLLLSYQNLFYIIVLPLISLITYWLVKKDYYYAEHLAINAFTFGTTSWLSTIIMTLTFYVKSSLIIFAIIPLVSFGFITYIYKHIFKTTWPMAFLTMILVYLTLLIIQIVFQLGLTVIFML